MYIGRFNRVTTGLLHGRVLISLVIGVFLVVNLSRAVSITIGILTRRLLRASTIFPIRLYPFFFRQVLTGPTSYRITTSEAFLWATVLPTTHSSRTSSTRSGGYLPTGD